jgi:hypothetical protein
MGLSLVTKDIVTKSSVFYKSSTILRELEFHLIGEILIISFFFLKAVMNSFYPVIMLLGKRCQMAVGMA